MAMAMAMASPSANDPLRLLLDCASPPCVLLPSPVPRLSIVCYSASSPLFSSPSSSSSSSSSSFVVVKESPVNEAVSAVEPRVLKVQRPLKRFSDIEATNVKEEFEDVPQWSIGSWVEEVKVGLEEQVAFSGSQIKAAALKELIKKLEAQNIYDFSNLCSDEQLFKKAVQALDSTDKTEIRIFVDAFVRLLQICIAENNPTEVCDLYGLAMECGIDADPFLGANLIRTFTRFRNLKEAMNVFVQLPEPDAFSWNAIIIAHSKLGHLDKVMGLYHEMCRSCVQPNSYVFISVLKACCMQGEASMMMQVHSDIVSRGLESHIFLGSTLIDTYVKCSLLEEALAVFRGLPIQNIVTWTALISGHAAQEHSEKALQLFMDMQKGGVQPNPVTFVAALRACSDLGAIELGNLLHSQIIEANLELDLVLSSSIVDMYAKGGRFEDAQAVFDKIEKLDVVAWSSLISRFAQHDRCEEALHLFWSMLRKGMVPDYVALATVLQICPSIAALEQGRVTHMQIIKAGFDRELPIGSSLVSMYARLGDLEAACVTFQLLPKHSILTWNSIILGCAQNNNFTLALRFLHDMREVGMAPTGMIFLSVMSACNSVGLLAEGCYYFKLMRETDDVFIMIEHYYMLLDLLGRMSCLDMAEDLLESVPFRLDERGWMLLLDTCRIQGSLDLGRRCFDYLLKGSSSVHDTAFVIMKSLYEQGLKEDEARKIEELRRTVTTQKQECPKAFIELGMKVYSFTDHDALLGHPQRNSILLKLADFGIDLMKLKESSQVEDALCGYSEMLAVAFALLNTTPGRTIRVAKNHKMCAGCHNALKIISKAEMRKIIISVSGGARIHSFSEGFCSCKDIL